ncbi:MAG: ComF family protein [Desulfobaccales bacterium]
MAPLSLPNLKRFSLNLLGFFLPRFCLFCGAAVGEAAAQAVCPECESQIEWVQSPLCLCCCRVFTAREGEDRLCGDCATETPPYDRARAAALYEGPVAAAIKGFKFSAQMTFLPVLQSWLHRPACLEMAASADLLVPVPLHPRRLKARGFNQSWLLARGFKGAALGREVLTRVRYTVPQVGLKPKERRANVRAAFSVSRPEEVQGKNVLLIDDLYTTGSTVKECALALRRAGAARVEVLTVARVKQE